VLWTKVPALLLDWVSSEPGGAQEGGGWSVQVEWARHLMGLHGTLRRCNNRDEVKPGFFVVVQSCPELICN